MVAIPDDEEKTTRLPGADATVTGPGTVTRLLTDLEHGDEDALEALFPIVYDELRGLAHRHRGRWIGDETMDTTALVHEAYLKLTGSEKIIARTRVHFMRVASRAMRHILSNYARERRAGKRGGGSPHLPLEVIEHAIQNGPSNNGSETLEALNEALQKLDNFDRRLSDVIECRFFGDMTIEETAEALENSPATAKRDLAFARAWLFREMTR